MRPPTAHLTAGTFSLVAVLLAPHPAAAQNDTGAMSLSASTVASSAAELRRWETLVDSWTRGGELARRRIWVDPMLGKRRHERLAQFYRGVPVFGADIARQTARGVTVSIFGRLYPDIDLDTTPALSAGEAAARIEALAGAGRAPAEVPELTVLPRDGRGYVLTYRAPVLSPTDLTIYFVDARTGNLAWRFSDLKTQSAVGAGTGVLRDRKKISTRPAGGGFVARDGLRPADIMTFDMRSNLQRTMDVLDGDVELAPGDLASDTDNVWTDGANVDAHVYAGWTYDYLFKRFGRMGLDGDHGRMITLVHPVDRADFFTAPANVVDLFFLNAFYCGLCGTDGRGIAVLGEGLPPGTLLGTRRSTVDFFSGALDLVAHELAHGVTAFTSGLLGVNIPGALNEAFSDIIGTSVEFFFQPPGTGPLRADYLMFEDVIVPPAAGFNRSLADPRSLGNPDHLSRLFTGTADNGGVHINSTIATHAFYLAIEGGTNRTSGLTVGGVGSANRRQIEDVFFRAWVFMLPSDADFSMARAATLQSAHDLFGAGSRVEQAVRQAWDAVGVASR